MGTADLPNTFTVPTSDSGACSDDSVSVQGPNGLSFATMESDLSGCLVGTGTEWSSVPCTFTIEGDGIIVGTVTVAGSIMATGPDSMFPHAEGTTWNYAESDYQGIPSAGTALKVPRVVLTAETELELEALRTLVYDAREKGHGRADEWAAALEQFKSFRQGNY